MVWVILFCSPVAELSRWLRTQKLSEISVVISLHSQSLSDYIYTCIQLHTPTNPTCSRWYDPERLKADFKPHPPPQMGEFNVQHVKTNMLKYGSTYLCRHLINCIQTLNAKKHEAHGSWGSTLLFKNYQGGLIIIIEVQYHIKHLFLLFSWKVFVVTS